MWNITYLILIVASMRQIQIYKMWLFPFEGQFKQLIGNEKKSSCKDKFSHFFTVSITLVFCNCATKTCIGQIDWDGDCALWCRWFCRTGSVVASKDSLDFVHFLWGPHWGTLRSSINAICGEEFEKQQRSQSSLGSCLIFRWLGFCFLFPLGVWRKVVRHLKYIMTKVTHVCW